jgi:hypothetical protein
MTADEQNLFRESGGRVAFCELVLRVEMLDQNIGGR